MKIETKDIKDVALLWAAVKAVWPKDACIEEPHTTSKVTMLADYGDNDIIKAATRLITVEPSELTGAAARTAILMNLVQKSFGEFIDVPDHLV
jgi:hypothetical protein